MAKVITVFVITLILIGIGWFSHKWYMKKPIETVKVDTVYVYHTVIDSGKTWIPRIIKIREPYPVIKEANLDSLWEEAKAFYAKLYKDSLQQGEVVYIAQKDTVYKDSILQANVSFNSPIPLHPDSYFYMDFLFRETVIDSTTIIDDTYFDTWSIGFGIKNQILNQRIQAALIGDITYKFINNKHFEVLARVKGEYSEKLVGSLESEGRIKF